MEPEEKKTITLMGGMIVDHTPEKIVVFRAGKTYSITIEVFETYDDGHCEILGAGFDIIEIKRGVLHNVGLF